ncbi:class I SAM-dependent methyltransferase [Marinobacterium mangrovicola]|uniref:Methyltransferase family protein n=1 Tax=Marinobacterium mangrovicola TaxID=1476959 RepID=A0A4R1GJH5_9GAMM|nr:class I SAM-dependent methyltransferase [Marinobacterium mangrovicola]TCK06129.1 methyltransferase family protein [Marinobacterium mangrovicola]
MSQKDYYDENAQVFFDSTVDVDMAPLYQRVLPLLPTGASILDAGCGSGRDAVYFKRHGYSVTAFDASESLCVLASAHLGQDVHCMRFDEIEWQGAFHAVWACASLLHVPYGELPVTFERLFAALKPGGVLYCSFKYGSGEREFGGRTFTDLDESGLERALSLTGVAFELETWVTEDQRPGREESWLNALIRLK